MELCLTVTDQSGVLLFTSATWPEGVRRMAESYMVNPMQVYVGSLDLAVSLLVYLH